jgi:hypothetical protein
VVSMTWRRGAVVPSPPASEETGREIESRQDGSFCIKRMVSMPWRPQEKKTRFESRQDIHFLEETWQSYCVYVGNLV